MKVGVRKSITAKIKEKKENSLLRIIINYSQFLYPLLYFVCLCVFDHYLLHFQVYIFFKCILCRIYYFVYIFEYFIFIKYIHINIVVQ